MALCHGGIIPSEEYIIEWIHRLVAVTTGIFVALTSVSVWINKKTDRKIKFTSTFATILVITQIGLGVWVIDLKLQAVLVVIHLGIGILLFTMVLLTTLFAFRISKSNGCKNT